MISKVRQCLGQRGKARETGVGRSTARSSGICMFVVPPRSRSKNFPSVTWRWLPAEEHTSWFNLCGEAEEWGPGRIEGKWSCFKSHGCASAPDNVCDIAGCCEVKNKRFHVNWNTKSNELCGGFPRLENTLLTNMSNLHSCSSLHLLQKAVASRFTSSG